MGLLPTAANAYRAEASLLAVENLFNLILEHRIEIVRHFDSGHKAHPLYFALRQRVERHDLDQGLAGRGDDEGLALGGAIDEARQMRLGFMDVDGSHEAPFEWINLT